MLEEQQAAAYEQAHSQSHPSNNLQYPSQQNLPYVARQNTSRRRSGDFPPPATSNEPSLQDQFRGFFSAPRRDGAGTGTGTSPPGNNNSNAGGGVGGVNTAEIQEEFKKIAESEFSFFPYLF